MRAALLGFIAGALTLGYLPWLMPGAGWAAFVLLILLLVFLLSRASCLLHSHSAVKLLVYPACFVAAFFVAATFSQHALQQAIKQRPTHAQQLTALVYVGQISDGVGDDWQQTVQVVGRGPYTGQRLILYTAYQSWLEGSKVAPPDMQPGQFWQVDIKLKPAHNKASPHAFDVEKWLLSEHVLATATLVSAKPLDLKAMQQLGLLQTRWIHLQAEVQQMRLGIRQHVSQFASPAKGVLLGLLTGDRSLIDRPTADLYRQMGISHLLAISGPHVVLAALMLLWLCSRILNCFPKLYLMAERRRWLLPVFVLAVLAYASLAGFDVPAQRTVIMLLISSGLLWWRKRLDNLLILLLAATILLLLDPLAVLSAAFWLSFGAVAILLSMSREPLTGDDEPKKQGVQAGLKQAMQSVLWFVRLQWRLLVVLTPLTLWCFGQVSLLGPIVNILAIPLFSFCILPLNMLALAVSGVSPGLADMLWQLAMSVLQGLHQLFLYLSLQFPKALQPFYLHWTAAIAAGLIVTILLLPRGMLPRWWIAFLLIPVIWPYRPHAALAVHVLDVGQGLSVLVQTGQHTMLIDTGGKSPNQSQGMGEQVVLPVLRSLGAGQLDQLLLTHQDKDHVGGAPEVLAGIPVSSILTSELPAFKTHGVPVRLCQAGQHWVWDGIKFSILSPRPEWTDLNQNDASCVLMIELPGGARHPAKRLLIMGDAGFYTEYLLQQRYEDMQADILILGHHGSKNSSSSPFIQVVKPRRAVVSAGFLNAYGHPAPEVLARLKEQGVLVDSTVSGGTLSYYLNAQDQDVQPPLRYRDSLLWLERANDADGGLLRRQKMDQ